jgi:CrcB protein
MLEPEPDPLTGPAAVGEVPVDPDVTDDDRAVPPERSPAHVPAPEPSRPAGAGGRVRPRGRARVEYLSRRTRRVLVNRGDILAVIAAGGALGSLARWGLAQAMPHPAAAFPWATFDANVSGCFLLGVLMIFVTDVWPPSRYVRPFLGVGVLGGFTTFSTYTLDTRALLLSGRTGLAGLYVLASLVCGLIAVWAGIAGARALVVLARHRVDRRRWREHATTQAEAATCGPATTAYAPPTAAGSTPDGATTASAGNGSTASASTTTRSPR